MRKPKGFWTDKRTQDVLEQYVRGILTLAQADEALGGTASERFSAANVIEYYARPIRKRLDIPRPKEIDVRPFATIAAAQAKHQAKIEQDVRATIGEGGRLVIPVPYRDALGVREGTEVVMSLTDGELRIRTLNETLRRARMLVRRYIPEGRSLADELIAERRREARSE
jgi:AbrB family looped-hinge helix DNA binding protein